MHDSLQEVGISTTWSGGLRVEWKGVWMRTRIPHSGPDTRPIHLSRHVTKNWSRTVTNFPNGIPKTVINQLCLSVPLIKDSSKFLQFISIDIVSFAHSLRSYFVFLFLGFFLLFLIPINNHAG